MGFILRSPVKSKQQSWARVIMAVSPRSKLICTRNASNLWMSTKTAPSANLTSALPSTTLVNWWTRVSSTACWEKFGGGCNFDNMVKMFQEKMAGGSNDPDDLIVRAFKAYEVDGKIESEMFRHALMNFGDKFNKAE